jgi:hypothetical protein
VRGSGDRRSPNAMFARRVLAVHRVER